MAHHHIRWSGGILDWERFSTRAEAQASADQLMRPEETYSVEEYTDETCPNCSKWRAAKHLTSELVDITADHVELYLRDRLRQRVRIKSSLGIRERNLLQPATVHQEFRVLRRMLNVAVRKKLLPANPCAGVEFPVRVKGLFRPHYAAVFADEVANEERSSRKDQPPSERNAAECDCEFWHSDGSMTSFWHSLGTVEVKLATWSRICIGKRFIINKRLVSGRSAAW